MMTARWLLLVVVLPLFLRGAAGDPIPAGASKVALAFQGGHETDPHDHGRPVVLIAAALGVPAAVFREAFSHVQPAAAGEQPRDEQVHRNKFELMSRLAPYGVTDERLNEVSDYYRYRSWAGELWHHVDATGYAIVQGGKIISITLTNPGAGYTTPPVVSVPGTALTVYPLARLAFGRDLATNGSAAKIDLCPIGDFKQPPAMSASDVILIKSDNIHGSPPPPPPPPPHP